MSCRQFRILATALALGVLAVMPAWAASPTESMEAFFDQANGILRAADRTRGIEETRKAIRQFVNEMIEFREAAANALGPAWYAKPPEVQNEFIELCSSVLERGFVAAIVTRANLSGGVKIQYTGETVSGDQAVVSTTLLGRNGSDVPVEYRLVRRADRWKVQDVIIEDVSLIANYRAQFSRILRDYPYTGLVAKMKGETPESVASEATAGGQDSSSVSWARWVIGHMGDEKGVPETMPVREERD
jgi:phospholipid transport system substrate-binding protein